MWAKITGFIIRQRIWFLAGIIAITALMGYKAKDVSLDYNFPQVIPVTDPDYEFYTKFKKQFGEDGDLLVLGFQNKDVFDKNVFNAWLNLSYEIKKLSGVKTIASVPNLVSLQKDTIAHSFVLKPFVNGPLTSQNQADSLKQAFLAMPFYRNLFYNDSSKATLMAIKLDSKTLRSKNRFALVDSIENIARQFEKDNKIELRYSGLPYIRTIFAQKIQQELNFFLILSVAVTSLILLIFFRSIYNVIFPLTIIAIVITWTMGFIVLLGYKLTLLTGLIPPLIVIIAVPNFIYFLNRYHNEYKKYQNKFVAILRMTTNIARVIFLNNVTTAIGFGVLFFVESPVMKEFGVVAFLMITSAYFATLIMMPIIFSYLPAPSIKQTKYLDNKPMTMFVNWVNKIAHTRRKLLYSVCAIIAVIACIGLTQLRAIGYVMDDIPEDSMLSKDLAFFEHNFKGLMPFEIVIDTKEKNGLFKSGVLQRLEQVQDTLAVIPEFASSMSIVNVGKYARQAFYNGSVSRYSLPSMRELSFMRSYLKGIEMNKGGNMNLSIVDSNFQVARISAKMSDAGSVRLAEIKGKLDKDIDTIFKGSNIKHDFTGFSIVFLKGGDYLVSGLVSSLISAIIMIIIVIAFLFPSVRLVVITLIPNILAILVTAGIMGYFKIPLKPSTILVFSIAFGIAVDASFHFLVTYRMDLMLHNWDISKTITYALNQTGASIIYTSLVLFFGFGIFCFSTFGSTIALGALTSITILCAMFTNIILIPALLLSFDKKSKKIKM
ncbi:MAG: Fis family transcriptional regulator [Sphingobacteriales bacterium]|nr:MAG: Fis family transcriptional regulator [Sphingobacteriales bacterium]